MTAKQAPPVMILGCGRSGTSIFGELFASLAGYEYESEPAFCEVVGANYATPRAFKVPRESEGYPPDPGLSFPLATLTERVPEMRFFWIVRHPLDAICSLRVGISKDWGHHPKPPDWKSWLDRPLVERCAHHWAHINSAGFSNVAGIASVVTFENMIASPERFVDTVRSALKLEQPMLGGGVKRWVRRVQNTNNEDFVEAVTSRSYSRNDHSVRIGRWRENLSAEDVSRVLPIVVETGKAFGYAV